MSKEFHHSFIRGVAFSAGCTAIIGMPATLGLAQQMTGDASPIDGQPVAVDSVGSDFWAGENVVGCASQASACDMNDSLFGRGIIKRSDHDFDRFISPSTNPIYFEDPRNVTEIRGLFIQHEGLDLINLGSPGVTGNNIVTQAFGAKLKPSGNQEIGLAYEIPLTRREDILENRITVDWIFRY